MTRTAPPPARARRSVLPRGALQSSTTPLLPGRSRPAQALVATASAGLTVGAALPGGAFDVVVRHEIAVVVLFALGLGILFGLLPRARVPPAAWAPAVLLTALGCYAALGLAWTESLERTEVEVVRLLFMLAVVLFWLTTLDARTWRAAAAGLAIGGAVVCALSLAARLWPAAFPVDHVGRSFGYRLNYPIGAWNALGSWAAMTCAMCLAWSAHARASPARALALATLPVAATTAYLTYSRGGLGALVLGALAVVALSRNRWLGALHALCASGASAFAISVVRNHPQLAEGAGGGPGVDAAAGAIVAASLACAGVALLTRWLHGDRWRLPQPRARVAVVVTLLAVVVAAVPAASGAAGRLSDEFRNPAIPAATEDLPARLTSASGTGRADNWAVAIDAFESRPFPGVGLGTYEFVWNRAGRSSLVVEDAHSLYLEALGEAGVIGLVLLVGALGAVLALGLRRRFALRDPARAGAAAGCLGAFVAFLAHAGIEWLWEATAPAVLALSAGAVLLASDASLRARPPRLARRIVPALACVLAALLVLPSLVSVSNIRRSQEAVQDGDLRTAYSRADEAVASRPWAASPYAQRALVAEVTGDLRSAARDLRRARERETGNWTHPLLQARVQAELGRPRRALAAIREARRLRPKARQWSVAPAGRRGALTRSSVNCAAGLGFLERRAWGCGWMVGDYSSSW